MAEAFALFAAVPGLLDVAGRSSAGLVHAIQAWKNVPASLLALSNEVSDLQLVLGHVATLVGPETSNSSLEKTLGQQIKKASQHLGELDSLVAEFNALPKYKQKARWIARRSTVEQLKNNLKEVRSKMADLLLIHNVTASNRIGVQLKAVQAQVDESNAASSQQLDMIESLMSEWSRFTASYNANTSTSDTYDVPETQLRPTEQQSNSDTVSFTMSLGNRFSQCDRDCPCSCHPKGARRTLSAFPRVLAGIFGAMFIGYTGYPVTRPACDHHFCRKRGQMQIAIVYCFPLWFLRSVLVFMINKTMSSGITIQLSLYQRVMEVPGDIFSAADTRNLELGRRCIRENPACVNFISAVNGMTPLHHSVYHPDIQFIQMLLRNGADPYIQAAPSSSAVKIGAYYILVQDKNYTPHLVQEIKTILPISQEIDDMEFSLLHKAVLGICPLNLKTLLQSRDRTVLELLNSLDETGRTPLHWAAARNDARATQELLEAGADVNPLSMRSRTPLAEAITSGYDDCVDILLNAGADIHSTGEDGFTIFHLAAVFSTVKTMDTLLRAGASIDMRTQDANEVTALTLAATIAERHHVLEYLLDHGADIEASDKRGFNALSWAVGEGYHHHTSILLSRGANYCNIDDAGNTILHHAARLTDTKTMEVLSAADLIGSDIMHRNRDGATAMEVQERFGSAVPAVKEAFRNLLQGISSASTMQTGLEDEQETFHDALEHQ